MALLIIGWVVVGGGVGYAIGNPKGQGGAGFALGLLLGFIGWIIVMVMEPSSTEQQRRQQAQIATAVAMGTAIATSGTAGSGRPLGPPPLPPTERPCPWCAELIKPAAIICRFCGRDVPPMADSTHVPVAIATQPINTEGWFPDPLGAGPERLWNGSRWTVHVRTSEKGRYWSTDESGLQSLPPPTGPVQT